MTHIGKQTLVFKNRPGITAHAAVVGSREGEGPLGKGFDEIIEDNMAGQDSFEKAEHVFYRKACERCIEKSGLPKEKIQLMLGGDLLNQIMASSLSARDLMIPFLGLYGACSTMSESLLLGAALCDGGYFDPVLCAAGSHFCTAERQYRVPLEYAGQRPPSAQWTVTGTGACILQKDGGNVVISMGTAGRVMDLGIRDAGNMGAAMAPAAADTLYRHLQDTKRTMADYDCIITGDLGKVGSTLMEELLAEKKIFLDKKNHIDCGLKIYEESEDIHAGGSGCGCSASVLSAWILPRLEAGRWKRIAFMATGALLSQTTTQQGETIPGVAHLVVLERRRDADLS